MIKSRSQLEMAPKCKFTQLTYSSGRREWRQPGRRKWALLRSRWTKLFRCWNFKLLTNIPNFQEIKDQNVTGNFETLVEGSRRAVVFYVDKGWFLLTEEMQFNKSVDFYDIYLQVAGSLPTLPGGCTPGGVYSCLIFTLTFTCTCFIYFSMHLE